MPLARARSIIAAEESSPRMSAAGQRACSSAVELPGPQPGQNSVRGH